MVKIELEKGVPLPQYTEDSSGFNLHANSILQIYKNDKAVNKENLTKAQKSFLERGYIKVRPLERILFSTGIDLSISVHENKELYVSSLEDISLKNGLLLVHSPSIIKGQIKVSLQNSSVSSLTTINRFDAIAKGTFKEINKPVFSYVINK